MAATTTPVPDSGKSDCKECDKKEKKCADLKEQIDRALNDGVDSKGDLVKGIIRRFSEQINGKQGPGTKGWETHEGNINNDQKGLARKLRQFEENGCGPPPDEAMEWATKPAPSHNEWIGNKSDSYVSIQEGLSTWQKVGLGLGVVALGAIAVISLGTAVPAEGALLATFGGGLVLTSQ